MNNWQKKITSNTWKLQKQTVVPLWSIASEQVIYAISRHTVPEFGKNSKRIRHFITLSKKIKLTDFLLFIIGFTKAFSIWQNSKRKHPSESKQFEKVFAGFGASSEKHMLEEFKRRSGENFLYINWIDYTGMDQLCRPTLFQLIATLAKNVFGHTAKFKNALPEIQAYEADFLTVCAKNVGLYSFFCAYWKNAKSHGVKEVIFLVPDMPAFACVEAKIKTVFMQHGLISLGILIPKLDRIDALTSTEESYLKNLFPDINIKKIHHAIYVDENKNNTIMILSPNTFLEERLCAIAPFINWSRNIGIKIVIRPTNKVTAYELLLMKNQFSDCIIDDIEAPIHQSLETWQPKFVAAWTSTGLALALEYGFLPISFCDPSYEYLQRMIYPLNERVFFWPSDKARIEQAVTSTDFYITQVLRLQNTPLDFMD